MQPSGVVVKFDVTDDVFAGVFPCRVDGAVHPLVLQRCEERLGKRVIVAYSGAAYRLPQVMLGERSGELADV